MCEPIVYKIKTEVYWCVANCGINFGEFAVDLSSVVTTKQWLGLKGQSFSLSQWFSKFVTGLFLSKVASWKSFVWFLPLMRCLFVKIGVMSTLSRAIFRRGIGMGPWGPFRTSWQKIAILSFHTLTEATGHDLLIYKTWDQLLSWAKSLSPPSASEIQLIQIRIVCSFPF